MMVIIGVGAAAVFMLITLMFGAYFSRSGKPRIDPNIDFIYNKFAKE